MEQQGQSELRVLRAAGVLLLITRPAAPSLPPVPKNTDKAFLQLLTALLFSPAASAALHFGEAMVNTFLEASRCDH